MAKTVVFVTNQFSCDRLIHAAHEIAQKTKTELNIIEILDSEYALDPKAIDYLFMMAKKANGIMRLISAPDKLALMRKTVGARDVQCVVTGIPSSENSVLHDLWKKFPQKSFYVVDHAGILIEVPGSKSITA